VNLTEWAIRHGVSAAALADLRAGLGLDALPVDTGHSERYVQTSVRLEAVGKGVTLWRNNVGVLEDVTGRPVRYGLANDSKALNMRLKSADLIGWRPIVITPKLIGVTIAQFVSRECKPAGWRYSGTDRERAQLAWASLVAASGGDARFATRPGTL